LRSGEASSLPVQAWTGEDRLRRLCCFWPSLIGLR
jgi:hypothetical protein